MPGGKRKIFGTLTVPSVAVGKDFPEGSLPPEKRVSCYFAIADWAAAILAFTASRLKLAPFCIGGNSTAVMASFSTCPWTNTKRQNSYLNQSKYCCAPYLVPLSGQPVRSKGSRRKLIR